MFFSLYKNGSRKVTTSISFNIKSIEHCSPLHPINFKLKLLSKFCPLVLIHDTFLFLFSTCSVFLSN